MQVLEKFVPKNKLNLPDNTQPSDLVFKVPGRADYIVGDHKMIDFRYIRKSLLKDDKVYLNAVLRDSLKIEAAEGAFQEEVRDFLLFASACLTLTSQSSGSSSRTPKVTWPHTSSCRRRGAT